MAQKITADQGSVIITGASDGIGRALAYEFARRKFSLGLIARRGELLAHVAQECLNLGSPKVETGSGDVRDLDRMKALYKSIEETVGEAAIFIANAGINIDILPSENGDLHAQGIFQVNVIGAVAGLEFFKSKWVQNEWVKTGQKRKVLCGVSSVAGARGLPGGGPYCASKAALSTYLEALDLDMRASVGSSITVVDLAPGFIDTAMTRRNRHPMPFLGDADREAKSFVDAVLSGRSFRIVRPMAFGFVYPILRHTPWIILKFLLGIAGKLKQKNRSRP